MTSQPGSSTHVRIHGAAVALALALVATRANASNGIDTPDGGVEQVGRGSAWVARADDPTAVFYNPAALAFQSSGIHIGGQLLFGRPCFTREGPGGVPVSPGQGIPGPGAPGGPPAQVCASVPPSPVPQIAATFRLSDRLAIGFGLFTPHTTGNATWPESVAYKSVADGNIETTQPAPNRYLLVSSNALILYPTASISYAPTDNLSFGAGFVWGIATAKFVNFSEAISSPGNATGTTDQFSENGDVKSTLKTKDLFMPGFVLGALWSPTRNLDVGASFNYQDGIHGSVNIYTQANYWTGAGVIATCPASMPTCNAANITNVSNAGHLRLNIPAEAKLGLRYHMPRADGARPAWSSAGTGRVRDPMTQDVFDLEADFTWAGNSAVDDIHISFMPNIVINGTPGTLPANADIPHMWKDVMGIRAGGEYVAVPGRFAVRAGGFFEAKTQQDKYLNLDFDGAQQGGLSCGATLRAGPVDVSVAYQHTFFGELNNGGYGGIRAISGDLSSGNRSRQYINGGILTNAMDEGGLAGTLHF